ncbi:hypothetical protein [Cryptosporangium arvum]|uniref:Uncharacterized protein n=1 Tax=Cryptosporangium arvum DSM 44712 TaxID=927661 RepID=A0A010YG15_9ACTN|nr:hypothetical protein [Cryptosporangium arvum]EXG79170.1 hypothetical protein CryarDRAFT_0196 [Cryptosporangium arvum DSM 44712]
MAADLPAAPVFALHCPVCQWTRTDPAVEQAALDIAGAHDDAHHHGHPTTVLVLLLTDPAVLDAAAGGHQRAAALIGRTITAAATAPLSPVARPGRRAA